MPFAQLFVAESSRVARTAFFPAPDTAAIREAAACRHNACAGGIRRDIRRPLMLTISQVTKAFAGRTLFEDASLQINRGDRVGLVGPNGAGKSTLFSLILGEASADDGKISIEKSASVGFLPQENAPAGEETVLELACGRLHGSAPDPHEHLDWEIEPKAKRILAGL